jgi:hypothetical protein
MGEGVQSKLWFRILRGIVVLCVMFGVIVFAANLVIDNPYTHSFARRLINKQIAKHISLRFNYQAVKIQLIPVEISLYGVEITESSDHSAKLLESSSVRVSLSLWSVIRGSPRLGIVEVSDLNLSWPLHPALEAAFDQDGQSSDSELSWPLDKKISPVEIISLRNVRLSAIVNADASDADQSPVLAAIVSGLNIRLNIADFRNIDVAAEASSVELKARKFYILDHDRVRVQANIYKSRLRKGSYQIEGRDLNVNGSLGGIIHNIGETKVIDKISLESTADLKGDLGVLGRVLGIEETAGAVTAASQWSLSIPLAGTSEPEFKLNAKADAKSAKMFGFLINDANTDLEVDLDGINFKDTKISIDGQRVADLNGRLGFNKSIDFDFSGSVRDLDFRDLMRALKVDFQVFHASLNTKKLRVHGRGEPFELKVESFADFDDFHFPVVKENLKAKGQNPTCRSKLDLTVNTKQLSFGSDVLNCFIRRDPLSRDIGDGVLPPLDAQHSSSLQLNGYISFDQGKGLDVGLKALDLNTAALAAWIGKDLKGNGPLALRIHGPYDKVRVDGETTIERFHFQDLHAESIRTKFSLSDGNLLGWEQFSAKQQQGEVLSESGQLRLDQSLAIDVNTSIKDVDSQSVDAILKMLSISQVNFGLSRAKGRIKGSLREPLRMIGNLDVELRDLSVNGDAYFDQISGSIDGQKNSFEFTNARITRKDLKSRGSIEINYGNQPDRDGSIYALLGISKNDRITANFSVGSQAESQKPGPSFDHLQILPFTKIYADTFHLSGQLFGNILVTGSFAAPLIDWEMNLNQARFLKSRIASIRSKGKIARSRLSTKVEHGNGSLIGTIDVDLSQASLPYSWDFKATRLDIRALGSNFFANDPRNYGYLSGQSKMQGHLSDWWRSKGNLIVNEFRLRFLRDTRTDVATIDLHNRKAIRMNLVDTGWEFAGDEDLILENPQMSLRLSTKGNRPPERLFLGFDGWFEVDAFRTLIPQLEMASGSVRFEGKLTGSIADPKLELRLREKGDTGLSLGIAAIRPAFTNISFDVMYKDGLMIVQSLTADKGKGRLNASGQLVLQSKRSEVSRIDLNFQNATFLSQVAVLKTFESELSGNVTVSGAKFPLLVAGDVKIARARSTRNFDLRDQIINTLKRKAFESEGVNISAKPTFEFDLRITAPESIAVYNRNIQADLSANLNLSGTDIVPIIGGQIEVARGAFAYKYRRDFRINQGIITFDDPIRPDPRLDILGVSETGGYRVFMAITGRASDPRIDLSIDPPTSDEGVPLTKVDILVLLSTGSLPEKQRVDVATQDVAKAEAFNLLVGQFEEPVEKLFDMSGQTVVQQVFIDSYAGVDGTPTARLNLPLNLHQDWDVIFRVDNTSQKLTVGYRVDDKVSLSGNLDRQSKENASRQTSRSDPTDTGVDLKFRFSYP